MITSNPILEIQHTGGNQMLDKGLIIQIDKTSVTVLTKDNAFYRLKRKPTMYLSQEIEFRTSDVYLKNYIYKGILGLAASFFLVLSFLLYFKIVPFNNSLEFAYVSLDVNPSIEFGIDEKGKILSVNGFNKDGEEYIKAFDFGNRVLKDAFEIIISDLNKKGIIEKDSDILFSGVINYNNRDVINKERYAKEIVYSIMKDISNSGKQDYEIPLKIEIIEVSKEEHKEAKLHNISPGRYVLCNQINKKSRKISIEEAKTLPVKYLIEEYEKLDISQNTPDSTTQSHNTPFKTPQNTPQSQVSSSPTTSVEITNPANKTNTPGDTFKSTTKPSPAYTKPKPTASKNIISTPKITPNTPGYNPGSPSKEEPAQTTIENTPEIIHGIGTGLRGDYFDNLDLTNFKVSRVDSRINFYWGVGVPSSSMRIDESYSIRWTGEIMPRYSEEYTFYATRDNGVRLWVDGKIIIDMWNDSWNITDIGVISLKAGKKYSIKLEYYNNGGNGLLSLEWSSKSERRSFIPTECLYPSKESTYKAVEVEGNGIGLKSEYFDFSNLTNLKYSGVDSTINFNWGVGNPLLVLTPDSNFSMRWTGEVQPQYSEEYVFYATHDDGVRVWIDDNLVIDNWKINDETTSQTSKIMMTANKKYKIKVEYFNYAKNALIKLEWSSPSTKRSVVPKARLFPEK